MNYMAFTGFLGFGSFLWVIACLFALSFGSSSLVIDDIFSILTKIQELPPHLETIFWEIRLPRTIMASISGSGLAIMGLAVQVMVRNPMADPWLLGVSSGASLGAVSAIVFGLTAAFPFSIHSMAFLGALVAAGLIYSLTYFSQSFSPLKMILIGLALSFLLNASTHLLIFMAPHGTYLNSVLFWTLGSLGDVSLQEVWLPAVVTIGIFLYLYMRAESFNIFLLGDEKSFSMGVDPEGVRRKLFLICAFGTAVIVATVGAIGFVGLVVPHLIRIFVGSDMKRLIPASFIYGAGFLVTADLLSRTLLSPQELPIGVFTALSGAPILLLLARRLT